MNPVLLFFVNIVLLSFIVRHSSCNPESFAKSCDQHYPRLSREDIRNGSQPYILGGDAKDCRNCKSKHLYSQFCRFDMKSSQTHDLEKMDGFMRWVAVGKTANCAANQKQEFLSTMIHANEWDFLNSSPCDLWGLLNGRTTWFVGDSMTMDLFKGVECFLYEFWDSDSWEARRRQHREPHRDDSLPGNVSSMRPSCIDLPAGTRLCFVRGQDPYELLSDSLPWLKKHAKTTDILVLNTGLHGISVNDIHVIASYLSNYKDQLPTTFWKDVSAQHFKSEHGEYTGREVLKVGCAPLPKTKGDAGLLPHVTAAWLNGVSLPILEGANITIIHDVDKTNDLWNYHLPGECTHFCHPSAPQIWVHSFYTTLKKHANQLRSLS